MRKLSELTPDEKAERLRIQGIDAAAAMAEYTAATQSEDEKIARLRALRLERDSVDQANAAAAEAAKARAAKRLAAKKSASKPPSSKAPASKTAAGKPTKAKEKAKATRR